MQEETISVEDAAELLNVSKAYFLRLLHTSHEIPMHMINDKKEIYLKDVLEYKRKMKIRRRKALLEIVRLSEEMGLYEEED